MGPIQSSINQSLAILSMAASQDPTWRKNRELAAEDKMGANQVKRGDNALAKEKKQLKKKSFGTAPEPDAKAHEVAGNLVQEGLKKQLEVAKAKGDVNKVRGLEKSLDASKSEAEKHGVGYEQQPPTPEEEEFFKNQAMLDLASQNAAIAVSNKTAQVRRMEYMKRSLMKEDI